MINFWKTIKKPIAALAPMDGVTDFVFREIVAAIAKPDVLYTEFTSTDALLSKGRDKEIVNLMFSPTQRPIVAQLWGSVPENFEQAAKLIQELGFDGIDVNMGCPDKSIMKNNSGASLINNHPLVAKIISATKRGAPNLPLSVKTRLNKSEASTKEWLSFLLLQGIDTLIIHGRDAPSMSKGKANWDEIGKAAKLRDAINPDVLILGNGDVTSYQEVLEKHRIYAVDGVMIGRGIFHNPWIFERNENALPHTKNEYMDLLIKHTKLFNDTWGETENFEIMKKFFKVYIKDFRGADALRAKLMKTKSYEEAVAIIAGVTTL